MVPSEDALAVGVTGLVVPGGIRTPEVQAASERMTVAVPDLD